MVERYSNIVTPSYSSIDTPSTLDPLVPRAALERGRKRGGRRREGRPLRLKRMPGGKGGKSLRRRDGINRRSDRCKLYDQRKLESATAPNHNFSQRKHARGWIRVVDALSSSSSFIVASDERVSWENFGTRQSTRPPPLASLFCGEQWNPAG